MEKFNLTSSYQFSAGLSVLRPIIPLAGLLYLINFGNFKLKESAPVFIVVIILWFVYELYQVFKRRNFEVELTEETIRVNNEVISWSEIQSFEFKIAIGTLPAITLTCIDNNKIYIPGALENLAYVKNYIQSHVNLKQK
ncbi:MAG: hypothetical protein IPG12_14325 [Saprospiraceae bacterium]|nr:hypothetical protein [Saprospiraceae bacterium]